MEALKFEDSLGKSQKCAYVSQYVYIVLIQQMLWELLLLLSRQGSATHQCRFGVLEPIMWWVLCIQHFAKYHVDGLVQDCSNALEIWQPCTEPSMVHHLFAVDKAGVLIVSNGVINRIAKLTTLAPKQCRRMGWVHFDSNHNITWCKQGISEIRYFMSCQNELYLRTGAYVMLPEWQSMAKAALNVTKLMGCFCSE